MPLPTLYEINNIVTGKGAPWPNMEKDLRAMLKEFFAVQIFWLTLWAVKCS